MFAKAYDRLMQDVDYSALYETFSSYISLTDSILDAGCGSGYFLYELLKRGYDAWGIDIDESMLSIAKDRLLLEGLPQPLFIHDLRVPLGIKVDVIFMFFDVINYMKGPKGVLQNLMRSLKPGGRLIFDFYDVSVCDIYQDYVEIETMPFDYSWRITSVKQKLIHTIKINEEVEVIHQYVHPLPLIQSALEPYAQKIEIKKGPDLRKIYVIAYR